MTIMNGRLDESKMIRLGTGVDKYGRWYHLAPPGTAARLTELQRLAVSKYGVRLVVTPGWNIYRPLRIQRLYRAELGNMAAIPGSSSHGGTYGNRISMAADIQNWRDLGNTQAQAWARFKALCRIVGFTVDFVKPQELWHVGDFDPWTVPKFANDGKIKPFPTPTPKESIMEQIFNEDDKNNETRRAQVGELSFEVLGPAASALNRTVFKQVLSNVDQAGWNAILAGVNKRRAQNGLWALKGVRGETVA